MGCVCCEDKVKIDLPKLQLPPSPHSPAHDDQTCQSAVPETSTSARSRLPAGGYKFLSHYRLGSRRGLELGELTGTKKRCVVHVFLSQDGKLKRATERTAMQDAFEQLDHPYIRTIYGAVRDVKATRVILETCEAGELVNLLEDKVPFSETQTALIIKQLLEVLHYLHLKHLQHGQLQPEWIGLKNFGTKEVTIKVSGLFAKHWDKDRTLTLYDAPELEATEGGAKADIWSCGVLLYQLLAGRLPFECRAYRSSIRFDAGMSEEVKAMVREMLSPDPDARPSAAALLARLWFQRYSSLDFRGFRKGILLLKEVHCLSPLRAAVLRFIIENLEKSDKVSNVAHMFVTLDTDHDGALSGEEILAGLRLVMTEAQAQSETRKIMSTFGKSGGASIQYSEFLVGVLEANIVSSSALLVRAFRLLDYSHNGVLSVADLSQALQLDENSEEIAEASVARKGQLDWKHFREWMQSESNTST